MTTFSHENWNPLSKADRKKSFLSDLNWINRYNKSDHHLDRHVREYTAALNGLPSVYSYNLSPRVNYLPALTYKQKSELNLPLYSATNDILGIDKIVTKYDHPIMMNYRFVTSDFSLLNDLKSVDDYLSTRKYRSADDLSWKKYYIPSGEERVLIDRSISGECKLINRPKLTGTYINKSADNFSNESVILKDILPRNYYRKNFINSPFTSYHYPKDHIQLSNYQLNDYLLNDYQLNDYKLLDNRDYKIPYNYYTYSNDDPLEFHVHPLSRKIKDYHFNYDYPPPRRYYNYKSTGYNPLSKKNSYSKDYKLPETNLLTIKYGYSNGDQLDNSHLLSSKSRSDSNDNKYTDNYPSMINYRYLSNHDKHDYPSTLNYKYSINRNLKNDYNPLTNNYKHLSNYSWAKDYPSMNNYKRLSNNGPLIDHSLTISYRPLNSHRSVSVYPSTNRYFRNLILDPRSLEYNGYLNRYESKNDYYEVSGHPARRRCYSLATYLGGTKN